MFAWLIFVGMSYGVRVGAHIGVDARRQARCAARAARVVGIVAALLCIVYACIVTFGGYQYVRKMHDVGILMQDMPVAAVDPARDPADRLRAAGVPLRCRCCSPLAAGKEAHLLGDEAEDALKLQGVDETRGGRGHDHRRSCSSCCSSFMLLGMPVAVALGLSSLLTILLFAQDSLASLSLKLFETSEHYTLLAIPFFILGGAFMTTGGVAKRMIRFANACIGHLRGGLAMASVMACMLFAAVSGSSPATVVAVGLDRDRGHGRAPAIRSPSPPA